MTLLPTLSLLTATTSYILTPSQKSSVREDIKSNIKLFSPFRSGATTLVVILQLLCFRILKIAPMGITLRLLALQDNSDSGSDLESNSNPEADSNPQICAADPAHTPFLRFIRRSFLLFITIPLYITVLLSGRYEKWIMGFTTALLSESIIAEILTILWISKIEVRSSGDWPRSFLLGKAKDIGGVSDSGDDAFYDHLKKSSDETCKENEGHKQEEGQTTISQADTLCEYVERLYKTIPTSSASSTTSTTSTSTKIPPKTTQPKTKPKTIILSKTYPPLKALFNPSQSKCPHHWSCTFHTKIQQLSKIIFYVYAILEPILTTYLLLTSLKTILIMNGSGLLNRLMENNLIFGILATAWDILSVVFLVLFIYVFFNILFYVLTTRIRIQDRILDFIPTPISISLQGLFQNHTIIRAILLTILRQLFTAGPTYSIIFNLVPVRRLDVEVLSWIIASGFVLGIYFGGYFVVSRVVCDDATGATGTAATRKIKEKRFEMLRMGVLIPTIVFWGVLFG